MSKMESLNSRFERFVTTLDGFESIDALLKGNDQAAMKRADYLFSGRSIIVEQKVLENDPAGKPQKSMDKFMREGHFVVFGTLSTDAIFRKLKNGEELKARMFDDLTKQIDGAIAHADKQSRDTRKIFGIPDALGIVIILNENALTLAPDIIRYGVQRPFAKRLPDGTFRYPHNQGVIVLSEAHAAVATGGTKLHPILPFFRSGDAHEGLFDSFSRGLMEGWAQFNGVPLLRSSKPWEG